MIEIENIIDVAKKAGEIIMAYYKKNDIGVNKKEDDSPVTKADSESNDFICSALAKLYPEIAIISEEGVADEVDVNSIFWSVDPLDATQSFIDGEGEFTVNIGLVVNNEAVLGVVYAPLSRILYYTDGNVSYKKLEGEEPIVIFSRNIPETGAVVLVSALSNDKNKLDSYLKNKEIDKIIPISSAIKICMIAEGVADLYPRFGKTMEWDTAAAHAILRYAGGYIKDLDGNELKYGKLRDGFYNPEFIVAGRGI